MKKTYYYMAPLEGITGYVFRSAHHRIFPGADKYFTPFITPNQTRKLTSRELNDVLPEHNQGINLVPQIMTNQADDFIWAAKRLAELGYTEVNLNLGCPSGTVTAKGRGSGFLADPFKLDRFLCRVSAEMEQSGIGFSIKTRIGKDNPEEFEDLLAIYNRYPLTELIIHPRIQRDFYKNHPHMAVFDQAYKDSQNPVCYNGDLFNRDLVHAFLQQYPELDKVMLGRGVIANPALFTELTAQITLDKKRLKEFHDTILAGYQEIIPGDRNVLFKMKELWSYLGGIFEDSRKYIKKIRKAGNIQDYQIAAQQLFDEQPLISVAGYNQL